VIFYYFNGWLNLNKMAYKIMEDKIIPVKKDQEAGADKTTKSTVVKTEVDDSDRIAQLEAEKAKLIEESANYKLGMLKAKAQNKGTEFFEEDAVTETPEETTRRIIREELVNNKISQIDSEKEALMAKILRENKELKLANLNKTTTTAPSSLGTDNEGIQVTSSILTADQITALKARGWDDKMIERYKKNYQRYSGK